MNAVKPRMRRGGAQWTMTGFVFVLSLGMFAGAVLIGIQSDSLSAHGVRTTAQVRDKQPFGRGTSYELAFDTQDNRPVLEWSHEVPDGVNVGDRIQVVYDAANPHLVQDVRVLNRWPWLVAVAAVAGLFFLWVTRRLFRMSPAAWTSKRPR